MINQRQLLSAQLVANNLSVRCVCVRAFSPNNHIATFDVSKLSRLTVTGDSNFNGVVERERGGGAGGKEGKNRLRAAVCIDIILAAICERSWLNDLHVEQCKTENDTAINRECGRTP